MTNIIIPDFDFSAFYYPQILEALIKYKRVNVPELTDESVEEPSIQLLRAFALVGHLNNVLIDLVANESTLPTAKLVETVRNNLRLIAYELRSATPSQADLIYELSKVFSSTFELIPANSQAATKRDVNSSLIYFEALDALEIDRTDKHSYVLCEEDGIFTDRTTEANDSTPGTSFTPWATPITKDAIYWGHKQIMWNKLSIFFTTPLTGIINGVWEFYDGEFRKNAPTSVTNLGSTLKFDLTSLLGLTNRKGTLIRVQLNETTAYEDLYSTWDGTKNIITTLGLLGQSTVSTDKDDYSVGSDWSILESLTDGTNKLIADGDIEYPIPQTISQNWITNTIDGKEAYWLRYRIIDATGVVTNPVFLYTRMDLGNQYACRLVTQGRTITQNPLGSSIGLPDQTFESSKDNFIWDSETLEVEGEVWTRVENFLDSSSTAKHYMVLLGENDKATFKFGGNGKGKVPPLGVGNIKVTYRYNAEIDGNVGANTIIVDKTGLTYIRNIFNPRQATGWTEAQGSTEESLELAKISGPASLRTKDVAIGPEDVEDLSIAWIDENGVSPFSRAIAIEEGFGPKTIELVLVAAGGGLASSSQLEAIEEYFNGNKYSTPPIKKHLVANQEVQAVNYTQKVIDITAIVYGDTNETAVRNKLASVLHPEAKKDDGITFEWTKGAKIATSKLISIIFKTDNSITDVDLTIPSSDIILQTRELPILGTVNITIV